MLIDSESNIVLEEGTTKNVLIHVTDSSTDKAFDLTDCTCSIHIIFKDQTMKKMDEHILEGAINTVDNSILFSIEPSWSVNAVTGIAEIRAYKGTEVYGIGKITIRIDDYIKPYIEMPSI